MIKPIEISPLNTSKKIYFECDQCGEFGTIFLENSIINVDDKDNSLEPLDSYDCPKCNVNLQYSEKVINKIYKGDIVIKDNILIKGIIAGSVTVEKGASFVLTGIVEKDIIFNEDSNGEIHGVVNGNVINEGGNINISGIVNGTLTTNSGKTILDPNSLIKNVV